MMRWAVMFILLGVIGAAVAYDRVDPMPLAGPTISIESAMVNPAVTNPPRIDGAWYCPVGSSNVGGFADHQIDITNLSENPATAIVNILTADGRGPGTRVELEPYDVTHLSLSDYQASDVAGAVVEVIGGQGLVGHTVTTAYGVAQGPCATEVASEWYFANGRTEADSTQYLALMNPFPEPVVYDLVVSSQSRSRSRDGQFVPARSVKLVALEDFMAREEHTATKIIAKEGRLVVERLQMVDGVMGPVGASLTLGVTDPTDRWYLTAGRITDGGENVLTIANPAPTGLEILRSDGEVGAESVDDAFALDQENTATVRLVLWPTNPTDRSLYGTTPIEREIRPGGVEVIDLAAQAERFGFPLPYELSVLVESTGGHPIVVERWQSGTTFESAIRLDAEENAADTTSEGDTAGDGTATGDAATDDADTGDAATGDGAEGDGATADGGTEGENAAGQGDFEVPSVDPEADLLPQPAATNGLSTSRGNSRLSTRWLIPWISVDGDSTLVAVLAEDETSVEVRTLINGTMVGPVRAQVPAGGRTVIPLDLPVSSLGGVAVEVTADGPVAVEGVVVVDKSLDVVPAIPTVGS